MSLTLSDAVYLWLVMAGFVLAALPTFIAPTFKAGKANDVGTIMVVSTSAIMMLGFSLYADIFVEDSFNRFYANYVGPGFSMVATAYVPFLGPIAARLFADRGRLLSRSLIFVGLVFAIPMSFAGVAQVVDGRWGHADVSKYYMEFVIHMFDGLLFNAISDWNLVDTSKWIEYTRAGTPSLSLFHVLLGVFALSALWNVLFPHRAKA